MPKQKTYYYKKFINADYRHIWFMSYRIEVTPIRRKFFWSKLGYRYYFVVTFPNDI